MKLTVEQKQEIATLIWLIILDENTNFVFDLQEGNLVIT